MTDVNEDDTRVLMRKWSVATIGEVLVLTYGRP